MNLTKPLWSPQCTMSICSTVQWCALWKRLSFYCFKRITHYYLGCPAVIGSWKTV